MGKQAAWGLLVFAACVGTARRDHVHVDVQPAAPVAKVDIAGKNLAPKDEIDALISGAASLGKTARSTRVAVPPFVVRGADELKWMGEASAELVSAALTKVPNVSVLERGELVAVVEELKHNDHMDSASAVAAGKLLGAEVMIFGSLTRMGPRRFHVVIHADSVESGKVVGAVELDLDEDQWAPQLSAQLTEIVGTAGLGERRDAAGDALDQHALEQLARGRALYQSGHVAEAQPLYAHVLAKPTRSWRYESEYLMLMTDLGMYDWVKTRARAVLDQLPSSPDTACDRSRLQQQYARSTNDVTDNREAVRVAAACGDPSLIVTSLIWYGIALQPIHYPSTQEAFARAAAVLGPGDRFANERCLVEHNLLRYRVELEGDWKGERESQFLEVSKLCEHAGRQTIASLAADYAARHSWDPSHRLANFERAIMLARPVGGWVLDRATLASANALRNAGRFTEADARIIAILRARLSAVLEIYGGLPDAESLLPDSFFARVGVQRSSKPARTLGEEEGLIGIAQRTAFAEALRAWAERTRALSAREADMFKRVADRISPPVTIPASNFKARLDDAKLPIEEIDKLDKQPLYATMKRVRHALRALTDLVGEARAKQDRTEEDLLVGRIRKLAGWLQDPLEGRNALMTEAMSLAAKGEKDDALAMVHSSLRYAPDDPAWQLSVLAAEEKMTGERAPAERMIELARRTSVEAWIDANIAAQRPTEAGVKALQAAIDSLDNDDARSVALDRIRSSLATKPEWLARADVAAMLARRIDVVDRMKDPVASAFARADWLRWQELRGRHLAGSRSGELAARDPAIGAHMKELEGLASKVVDAAGPIVELSRPREDIVNATDEKALWTAYEACRGSASAQLQQLASCVTSLEAAVRRDPARKLTSKVDLRKALDDAMAVRNNAQTAATAVEAAQLDATIAGLAARNGDKPARDRAIADVQQRLGQTANLARAMIAAELAYALAVPAPKLAFTALVAAPRPTDDIGLSAADRQILAKLARQAGDARAAKTLENP